MPTFKRSIDTVFDKALPKLLLKHPKNLLKSEKAPLVYDLGSGDGRVSIAAANRGYRSVGYEINPLLVAFSSSWAIWDKYFASFLYKSKWPDSARLSFHRKDIWSIDLCEADVIFVYGLTPIMDRLSKKIVKENCDCLIVSNVFQMDSKLFEKVFSENEIYIYRSRQNI